jgi:DNA polymerase-3 subunit gamma/tau
VRDHLYVTRENSVRQSLYLKYRPQRFGDLVGQEVVARTLRNAVRERRLGHAYLFTGIRGTGKTSAARILARAINCEQPVDGEPCLICHACESVGAGRSLDVIEIDAATNRGIDEIRDLRERTQFLPSELQSKVYIIDEVHMLTTEAANAFLKTLEEPPEHACFILATTEPQRLVETILSRCQRFDFRRIPAAAMAVHLAEICRLEGVTTAADVMDLVAEAGAGSLRDAVSLLDRLIGLGEGVLELTTVRGALGMADPDAIRRLADGLEAGHLAEAWTELRSLEAVGVEPRQLLRALGGLARERQWALLERSGTALPGHFWLELMDACASGGSDLRRADDPWMAMEVILLKVSSGERQDPVAAEALPQPPIPPTPLEPANSTVMPPSVAAPISGTVGPTVTAATPRPAPPPPVAQGQHSVPIPVAAAVATAPAAASADFPVEGEWQPRWREVVDWAQHNHPGPFRALVQETRPLGVRDGALLIEVRYEWHLGQLQAPTYRALLEQACREVLGESLPIKLAMAGQAHKGDSSGTAANAAAGGSLAAALKHFPGSTVRKVDFNDRR